MLTKNLAHCSMRLDFTTQLISADMQLPFFGFANQEITCSLAHLYAGSIHSCYYHSVPSKCPSPRKRPPPTNEKPMVCVYQSYIFWPMNSVCLWVLILQCLVTCHCEQHNAPHANATCVTSLCRFTKDATMAPYVQIQCNEPTPEKLYTVDNS